MIERSIYGFPGRNKKSKTYGFVNAARFRREVGCFICDHQQMGDRKSNAKSEDDEINRRVLQEKQYRFRHKRSAQ